MAFTDDVVHAVGGLCCMQRAWNVLQDFDVARMDSVSLFHVYDHNDFYLAMVLIHCSATFAYIQPTYKWGQLNLAISSILE